MASKSFKFHGSQIQIMTGFSDQSPNRTISAITQASPPVVTSATHGLTDGDVIRITDVVGMDELNDELFVVLVVDANSFQLADADSTDYTAYTSGGIIDVAELSNFCEITNYNRQGGSKPEENTTSLCSTAQEYELGLRDFGTTQIDFKFAPRTTIQTALATFDASGDKLAVRVILPNSGGDMVQLGFLQQTSETAGNGGIYRGSMTIRNTGARVDIAAA